MYSKDNIHTIYLQGLQGLLPAMAQEVSCDLMKPLGIAPGVS